MVNTIPTEDIKNKLKTIFSNENKPSYKYMQVWLSEVDFGGLYQTDKFVVNVKMKYEIGSYNEEIKYIATNLFKQLSIEERSLIWRVNVYNSSEETYLQYDDIIVYSENDEREL